MLLWRHSSLLFICITIVAAQKGGRRGAASDSSPVIRAAILQRQESLNQIRQVQEQEPDRFPEDTDDVGIVGGGNGHAAPEPYQFSFAVDDPESGASTAREERQDINGEVVGFYLIKDQSGRTRRVDYTAGKDGFKARIKSNEEGIVARSPADVSVEVSASEGIPRYENSNIRQQLISDSSYGLKGGLQRTGERFFTRFSQPSVAPVLETQRYEAQHTEPIIVQEQQRNIEEDIEPPFVPLRPIVEAVKGNVQSTYIAPIKTLPRPTIVRTEIRHPEVHIEPIKRPQYTPSRFVVHREQSVVNLQPIVQAPVVTQQVHLQEPQQFDSQVIQQTPIVQQKEVQQSISLDQIQPVQEHRYSQVIQHNVQPQQQYVQRVEPLPQPLPIPQIHEPQPFIGHRTIHYQEQNSFKPVIPILPATVQKIDEQQQIHLQEEEPYEKIPPPVISQVIENVQQQKIESDTIEEPVHVQVREQPIKGYTQRPVLPLPPPPPPPPPQRVIEYPVKGRLVPPPPTRPAFQEFSQQKIIEHVVKRPVKPLPLLPPPPPPPQRIYESQQIIEHTIKSPPLPPPLPTKSIVYERPQQQLIVEQIKRLPPPPPPRPQPVFEPQQQLVEESEPLQVQDCKCDPIINIEPSAPAPVKGQHNFVIPRFESTKRIPINRPLRIAQKPIPYSFNTHIDNTADVASIVNPLIEQMVNEDINVPYSESELSSALSNYARKLPFGTRRRDTFNAGDSQKIENVKQ